MYRFTVTWCHRKTAAYARDSDRVALAVISRTTSEPSGGRARKMVAIVAGYRSFRTFRDCHTSILLLLLLPFWYIIQN